MCKPLIVTKCLGMGSEPVALNGAIYILSEKQVLFWQRILACHLNHLKDSTKGFFTIIF